MVSSATPTVISSEVPPKGNCATGRKNAKKIADANKEMAKAQDDLAKGNDDTAIDHWKNAWDKVTPATPAGPPGPPHP